MEIFLDKVHYTMDKTVLDMARGSVPFIFSYQTTLGGLQKSKSRLISIQVVLMFLSSIYSPLVRSFSSLKQTKNDNQKEFSLFNKP